MAEFPALFGTASHLKPAPISELAALYSPNGSTRDEGIRHSRNMEWCTRGLRHPDLHVCCSASCAVCGGSRCSGHCCTRHLIRRGRYCVSSSEVACLIPVEPLHGWC